MRPEFLEAVQIQSQTGQPYCLTTVVRVVGSASAKTGSKAIFDHEGRNIHGWIGGGCAERFVGEQSVEAIAEKQTRIVLADLDDEIFGLGIACGGRMEVFIEPIFPREAIELRVSSDIAAQAEHLARGMGFVPRIQTSGDGLPNTLQAFVPEFAESIARARGLNFKSLRLLKDLPVTFEKTTREPISKLKVLGKGRIVESLARWGTLLGWETTVVAPGLREEDYPARVKCDCLLDTYNDLVFDAGSAIVVASHHASDPEFVGEALRSGASYVGMIGSRKRTLEALDKNAIASGSVAPAALYVPAGFDIGSRTPEEIALSIVSEILARDSN